MSKENNYHEQVVKKNILKLREICSTLPPFCKDYFLGMQNMISSRTRIAYAYDLRTFFEYLHQQNPLFAKRDIITYDISVLELITKNDIEEYLEYITLYEKENHEYTNDERGKARKLASLRSFYNYFYRGEIIQKNPAILVPMPKLHEKEIIRLEVNEVASLLDLIENGEHLTKGEERYYKKNAVRDFAIITLLLGTGIRVSECVGLNINDVDLEENRIKVRRKGGNESIVYFGEEVAAALEQYLGTRVNIIPLTGSEDALFLSLQKSRLSVRATENLVTKYTSKLPILKRITPHKLRSTFGTNLYRETGDIYLVADFLDHKDVNTTRKHYASISDDQRRKAVRNFKLREDEITSESHHNTEK